MLKSKNYLMENLSIIDVDSLAFTSNDRFESMKFRSSTSKSYRICVLVLLARLSVVRSLLIKTRKVVVLIGFETTPAHMSQIILTKYCYYITAVMVGFPFVLFRGTHKSNLL